ncbi:MAG: leucine-rich repeat protein, partial [Bacteroidia bacterium]|nr:leucine-rich repeat protein [Bacteroidia bacterium]
MKQFFTHLAILFLMAIPVTAYAAYPTTSYQLSPDRTILLNWNGPETDIDLTSDPAFNSVTTIRETAFKEKKNIKSIKLTSAATNIDNNAFAGMTGLQTLILPPSGISAIPAGLLFGSTAIGSISIPTSVTAIGDNAFNGCTSLSTFNIPAGVTSIGAGAFSGVAATSINLPSTLTLIGSYAFSASKLISITLPGGITAIPEGLFSNCAALTSVTFPTSGITSVGSFAFESTRALAEITLPEGITTLGDFVFRGSGITSATLPNSITTIGIGGFQDCSSLTSANIPNQLAAIPVFTFYRTKLTSIIIPNSVKSIGERAFSNIWALQEITFPNSIEYIGNFSFASTNIKTISIPQSVKTIGGAAFDTHSLTGITVDPNNTVYSSDAEGVLFNKNKTELVQYPRAKTATEYTIPSTVTTILYSAMANVTSLITITIPNSVKEIHRGAFASCINLTTVTIPGSVTGIANNAFFNCPKLTTSHIPASVTGLGGGAFAGTETVAFTVDPANPNYMAENGVIYTKDKKTIVQYPAKKTGSSFEIPIGVERIEENCFGYCYNLTNINIPNSVTHIGSSAFSYSGITSIVIPNSVTGENMNGQFIFADSKSLTSVTLSDNITGLGPEVFRNCISLTSIKLPASLNYLSRTTFVNCTALTSIECANPTPPTLKENSAFTTLNQTAIALTVPLGSKYVYKSDNSQWRNFALATERDYTGAAFWFRTTAAPGTPFTITMGSNETNRTVQVDWGDGARESSYTLETSSNITGLLTGTPQGTPAELNIRVYGSGIHLIDLNGKPVTEINTFDNTATQGDLQKLIITGTPIKVVDVSKNINLTDLNITGLALTNKTLNLVANTKLANLNAANIGLTVLTLPTSNTLKILDVSGNALTAITLPASSAPTSINVSKNQLEKLVLPTNTSAMTKLDVSYNKLNIGTLPTKPANVTVANYTYTPQTRFTLPYDKYEKTVDLSSQDGKTGVAGSAQTTTYNWYRVDNNAQLVAGTDYSVTNGTTTFLKAQPQGVYAVMTTPAFPGLKSYTGTVASPVLDGGLRTQPASITSAGIVVTLTRTFLGVISSDWNTVSNWGNNTPAADNDDVQIS